MNLKALHSRRRAGCLYYGLDKGLTSMARSDTLKNDEPS